MARMLNIVSTHPSIYYVDNFLSEHECEHIIRVAKPSMAQSLVSSDKKGLISSGRTSSNTWIDHNQDDICQAIAMRIAHVVNRSVASAERFQVVYYNSNQEYKQHYDSWIHDYSEKTLRCMEYGGARLFTALVYLNDVLKGGETKFTKLNKKVSPKQGRFLFFENTFPDTNVRHPLSEHAGLPVLDGEKYVMNMWFRECSTKLPYREYNPKYYQNSQSRKLTQIDNTYAFKLRSAVSSLLLSQIKSQLPLFKGDTRSSFWLDTNHSNLLKSVITTLTDCQQDNLERTHIVQYMPNECHGLHNIAPSKCYKRFSNDSALSQRVISFLIPIKGQFDVIFKDTSVNFILEEGDVLCIKNMTSISSLERNENAAHSVQNLCNQDSSLAMINIIVQQEDHQIVHRLSTVFLKSPYEFQFVSLLCQNPFKKNLDCFIEGFNAGDINNDFSGLNDFNYKLKGDYSYFSLQLSKLIKLRSMEGQHNSLLNVREISRSIKTHTDRGTFAASASNVFHPHALKIIQSYYQTCIDSDVFPLGDRQSQRLRSRNEPISRIMQYECLPLIEILVGKKLEPTYTYISFYTRGADLPPHTDHADCEYTVSLLLDKPNGTIWPLYLHTIPEQQMYKGRYDTKPKLDQCLKLNCEAGSLLVFQGIQNIHFRESFDGEFYNVVLMHYKSLS